MKVLRTIRFDASDAHVFERAADPDELAVSGVFQFWEADDGALAGKPRQAFSNGFLGVSTFGRSTLVAVGEAGEAERAAARGVLADVLIAEHGAPDRASAEAAADEELAFASDLANGKPANTIIAVSRHFDDNGAVREVFRTVDPSAGPQHARIWDVVDD